MDINPGVEAIGVNNILSAFSKLDTTLPVVSIGSGSGEFEQLIMKHYPSLSIICVDPDPLDWCYDDDIMIPPDYATAETLVEKRPELVGECNVFINWPYPNDETTYDYDAIAILKPQRVICVVATCGASGGFKFLSFIKSLLVGEEQGIMEYKHINVVPYEPLPYKLVNTTRRTGWGGIHIRLIVLDRV